VDDLRDFSMPKAEAMISQVGLLLRRVRRGSIWGNFLQRFHGTFATLASVQGYHHRGIR